MRVRRPLSDERVRGGGYETANAAFLYVYMFEFEAVEDPRTATIQC